MDDYASPKEAAKYYGVSENTLRLWEKDGKIQAKRTDGGHRRYLLPKINETRRNILYARVSSRKQEQDLERQIKYLQSKYPNYEVIKDIGSGINYKRPGFKTILGELFRYNIAEVVVASSDRFTRLGANDLFKWIFPQFGAKLVFLQDIDAEYEDGLTSELMEIITVFTSRYYGKRKYNKQKSQNLSEQTTD